LWSWAPPIFEKIFIASALGAVTSYIFIPLTFLCLYNLIKSPNISRSVYFSLSLSGWLLSHLLTLIIFSPLLATFLLVYLIKSKKWKKIIKFVTISIFLCLGLSCSYLLPAVYELKFTHYSEFVKHQYASQFVPLKRLIYSKWGTDAPGWGNNSVSQQVGIAQWLSVVLAGLGLLFLRKKENPKTSGN